MRIHITTISTTKAAEQVHAQVQEGGTWIVHASGSEGYVAAKVGTAEGNALSRYGLVESLCGVYAPNSLPSIDEIADDMTDARKAYKEAFGDYDEVRDYTLIDRRGGGHQVDKFVPLCVMAEQALREKGPMTADEVARSLCSSATAARKAVKDLSDQGKIRIARRNPSKSHSGGRGAAVYEVAA